MPAQVLTPEEHRQRASRHRVVGDALADAGDEWAHVCYFYAAYHLVVASLLIDPLFDSPERLAKSRLPLIEDDRYTVRHNGRGRAGEPRSWGVNELVAYLYKPYSASYELLHQASIEVRYGRGRPLPPFEGAQAALAQIEQAQAAGLMKVRHF